MAEALILEFSDVTEAQYNAVNDILGINPTTGEGDWPAGLLSHFGGMGSGGSLTVVETWDSQASQATFMESRLGPALGQIGLPAPSRVEWLDVVGYHTH